MSLQEQRVFIPIKVEDEKPSEGFLHAIHKNKIEQTNFLKDVGFVDVTEGNNAYPIRVDWYSHWLKEEQKIVLSSSELIELLREAWNGIANGEKKIYFENFIKSKGIIEPKLDTV